VFLKQNGQMVPNPQFQQQASWAGLFAAAAFPKCGDLSSRHCRGCDWGALPMGCYTLHANISTLALPCSF